MCKKSKVEQDIEELKSQLKQAWSVIHDLASKCAGLQKEVARLKQNSKVARKQVVMAEENVDMERRVKELRTLNCTQVSQIRKPACPLPIGRLHSSQKRYI